MLARSDSKKCMLLTDGIILQNSIKTLTADVSIFRKKMERVFLFRFLKTLPSTKQKFPTACRSRAAMGGAQTPLTGISPPG